MNAIRSRFPWTLAVMLAALGSPFRVSGAENVLRVVVTGGGPAVLSVALEVDNSPPPVFGCDQSGIQAAIAAGGGPHTFSCAGPTSVTLSSEITVSSSVILDGGGNLTVSGNGTTRVFSILAGTVELRSLGVVDGSSSFGGCISVASGASLLLVDVTVSGCDSGGTPGGAIASDGSLTLTDSSVSASAGSQGAGIASGNTAGTASLALLRSTVSSNTATVEAGGIFVFDGDLMLTDSTISGNSDDGLALASAVGTAELAGSTISGNTGAGVDSSAPLLSVTNTTVALNGGAGIEQDAGVVALASSTLAGNGSAVSTGAGTGTVRNTILEGTCVSPAWSSLGGNLESPGDTCWLTHPSDQSNLSAAALKLGALADNGGPTETLALLTDSAAIDAATGCPPPSVDQRGVARPQRIACDSGAFELDIAAVPLGDLASLALVTAALGALGLRALRRTRPRSGPHRDG